MDGKNRVLYVGKAKNLRRRVASYFTNKTDLGEKTKLLINRARDIKIIKVHSEIEALLLEAKYIKKYQPQYNSRLTDGKAYPLIRITVKDDFPKVLTARRPGDKKSLYFGPYPNSGAMKLVLKTIRRIFPFQSVLNHPKNICLYNHLGLCPCPPVFNSDKNKIEYRKNIRHLIGFLEGRSKKVLLELKKERETESKKQNFEKADKINKRINSILIITSPSYRIFDEDIAPNLKQDKLDLNTQELKDHLSISSSKTGKLRRIECYDISNIQGKYAVGSLVVFTNGEKNSDGYRRFKIKYTPDIPNDFAMLSEVLTRRFKHPEWLPIPDLIIVDGGKGQVSSALGVLKQKKLDIPLIGLAKREETIVTSDSKEIHLPKDSKALLFIMRIRDEAHRFAITYHRKIRSKHALAI